MQPNKSVLTRAERSRWFWLAGILLTLLAGAKGYRAYVKLHSQPITLNINATFPDSNSGDVEATRQLASALRSHPYTVRITLHYKHPAARTELVYEPLKRELTCTYWTHLNSKHEGACRWNVTNVQREEILALIPHKKSFAELTRNHGYTTSSLATSIY